MIHPPRPAPTVALPAHPTDVPWPAADWPTSPSTDDTLHQFIADGFGATPDVMSVPLSLVAIKGGQVVAEHYGPTSGADVALISWSMAKSVLHALIGIAVADGRIDVHEPASVPEWQTPGDPRRDITMDQLLRMSSGMEFVEDYVDDEVSHCLEMLFAGGQRDMGAYAADRDRCADPDEIFNYSSGTSNILSRILTQHYGSGAEFEAWSRSVLFDRIGMDVTLTFDDAGTWVASSYLKATARDFARFGLLYLRNGWWDGEQILPAGWVDYARTRRAENEDGDGYGAHWWIWDDTRGSFHAAGFETQRIIVDPLSDVVLVRLGKTPTELGPAVDEWLDQILVMLR